MSVLSRDLADSLFSSIIADNLPAMLSLGLTPRELASLRHPSSGLSPLHVAAFAGADACLRALLEGDQGGELLALKADDSFTAAHYAAHEGHLSSLEILQQHGSSLSDTTDDHQYRLSNFPIWLPGGRTPLHVAAMGNHVDCCEWLVAQGLDPLTHDQDGNTSVALALLSNAESVLQWWEARSGTPVKRLSKEELHKISTQDYHLLRRRLLLSKRLEQLKEDENQYEKLWATRLLARQRQQQEMVDSHSDPEVLKDFHGDDLAPSYANAVAGGTLPSILTEESPGVFSFDFLKPEYCERLIRAVAEVERTQGMARQPNSMNRYGCVLGERGFGGMLEKLALEWVRPLCKAVFPMAGEIEDYYAFTIKYQLGEDVSLDMHKDSSDVTINVCLGKVFEGGTLYFYGGRSSALKQYPRHLLQSMEEKEILEYTHSVGKAVLHLGDHIHGAKPITKGERWNMIIWLKAKKQRKDEGCCG